MKDFVLKDNWQLCERGSNDWIPVTVPGSVMSAYLDAGRMEDPYYRENEYVTREMLRKDFNFRLVFEKETLCGLHSELIFEGIDTVAEVILNGVTVGRTDNMHRTWRFRTEGVLKVGTNELLLRFTSPITYMEGIRPTPGKEIHYIACGAMEGNQYIRKAHSMYGWDWGPQLPDIGLFRPVHLMEYDVAYPAYVSARQVHENGVVTLLPEVIYGLPDNTYGVGKESLGTTNVSLTTDYLHEAYATLTLVSPNGEAIPANADGSFTVDNPFLWWPNGLGKQPLYRLTVTTKEGMTKTARIGLRILTVSQEPDEWGSEFAFMVNGQKIFAKGADYIPEDCFYHRITRAHSEELIRASALANFNCIRIWGGGYYPSDDFYDLCDEYGLILWQDFMFACNVYDLMPHLEATIREEVIDNVRRLKSHASLGLWCGNNEMESAWDHWYGFCDHPDALRKDYLYLFEELIPTLLAKENPDTFYWPSSPSSGGGIDRPDDDNVGDRHYWDVWHGEKPFTDYEKYFFRFCSEFGFQSWPCMDTVRTFTKAGDWNIFSPVMESHQKNGTANAKILHYISENFLYPKDFEGLLYVSQVLQGIAIKSGVEHWRRNRGRCMGAVYWQLNDNWPVASWAGIDYYGRWKALQYMAKSFFANVNGSVKVEGTTLVPYVQNEAFAEDTTEVSVTLRDMNGAVIGETIPGQILRTEAFSVTRGQEIALADRVTGRERECFAEVIFRHGDATVSRQTVLFAPFKHMKLQPATLNVSYRLIDNKTVEVTVQSDVFVPFVELYIPGKKVRFDENFFDLTDGQPKTVLGHAEDIIGWDGQNEIHDSMLLTASDNVCARCLQDSYHQ